MIIISEIKFHELNLKEITYEVNINDKVNLLFYK